MKREANPIVQVDLKARYAEVRAATEALVKGLSAEDCALQSMPDASPVKWHLAHTNWFFETFVLECHAQRHEPFHPDFRYLFNSYYNTLGEQFARPQRGMLSRPGLEDIWRYRAHVDERIRALLEGEPLRAEVLETVELGLNHEQQHQELIVTDFLHLLSLNPLMPAWDITVPKEEKTSRLDFYRIEAGEVEIGHDGTGFAFDNELPRHRQFVAPFEIASRPVSNAEFLAFIELSHFEANAYAHWAGARLPTEFEWEVASPGITRGAVWEWTSSSYGPYPGFRPAAGAMGEYNGKFMSNQYVLRGGSRATPASHVRNSYRNFFPSSARWQFSGLRLARDPG